MEKRSWDEILGNFINLMKNGKRESV